MGGLTVLPVRSGVSAWRLHLSGGRPGSLPPMITRTPIMYLKSLLIIFVVGASSVAQGVDIADRNREAEVTLREVGSELWASMTGVIVEGELAYCNMRYGLLILDIKSVIDSARSTVPSPTYVSKVRLPGPTFDAAVSGGYAYIGDGEDGILIVNVSEPTAPFLEASFQTPGYARTPVIANSLAYVADGDSGLLVLDIAHPAQPEIIGGFCCGVYDLAVEGDYAYALSYGYELLILNVADPDSIFVEGSYQAADSMQEVTDMTYAGGRVYFSVIPDGLEIIDVSDPAEPFWVSAYNPGYYFSELAVEGDFAFMDFFQPAYGLAVINIADPEAPYLEGIHYTQGTPRGLQMAAGHVFLADSEFGLDVVDVSVPSQPKLAGRYDAPNCVRDVAITDSYLCAVDTYGGLYVVDVSEPGQPQWIGTCSTPGDAWGLTAAGNYAFVADGYAGLQIIDIANPSDPILVGSYDTPGRARSVAVAGDYAYVADGGAGLQIVNIADPCSPVPAGSYDTPGQSWDVAVSDSGDYAFVADWNAGLRIVNISDPENPYPVGSFDDWPGETFGVAVAGDYCFIANCIRALGILDVSNVSSPWLAGSADPGGYTRGVALADEYAYLAGSFYRGIDVINVADVSNPYPAGSHYLWGDTWDMVVAGDYVYVSDYYGVIVLSIAGKCGDINGDGDPVIGIDDLVYLVDYMFTGGPEPPDMWAANVDGQGELDISDLVYLVDYMFNDGPEPVCQ